jgi:hypothetical protein
LLWSCKDLAVSGGRYTGCRSIFFFGYHLKERYDDGSGWKGSMFFELKDGNKIPVTECACPSKWLIELDENGEIHEKYRYPACKSEDCLTKYAPHQYECPRCFGPYCDDCRRKDKADKPICRTCYLKEHNPKR